MTRRLVAGTGWKMNWTAAETRKYAKGLDRAIAGKDLSALDLYVLPPFTSLHEAKKVFKKSQVDFGAQNMHWENDGAWTGEVSAKMLVEAGCKYVALAHSERLQYFGETYEQVRKKVNQAIRYGINPVLCLGENNEEKSQGRTEQTLSWQLETALTDVCEKDVHKIIIAYEPRWAIGAKDAADPEYVAAQHKILRELLENRFGTEVANTTRIVYGGSVTASNGTDLIAIPDVDGLFVGRAAWSPDGFAEIINIVAKQRNNGDIQS